DLDDADVVTLRRVTGVRRVRRRRQRADPARTVWIERVGGLRRVVLETERAWRHAVPGSQQYRRCDHRRGAARLSDPLRGHNAEAQLNHGWIAGVVGTADDAVVIV